MVSGSPAVLSPLTAIHFSPSVAGGVFNLLVRLIALHLSGQSGWWFAARRLRLSPIDLSILLAIHLFPGLTGGVRLPGCLQVSCFPLYHFICFPVWLVVSGPLAISNSFVSPYSNLCVS